MQTATGRANWNLKDMVKEASSALAKLDADRLEELALSCRELNRELEIAGDVRWSQVSGESREAATEMAVFARVLEATRANRNVMNRLRHISRERLEYDERQARLGSRHGDD